MAITAAVGKDIADPFMQKKYSSSLRLWHWGNAIIIGGSLITVLINSTILDDRQTASFLKDEFAKSNTLVGEEQARSVAHALSDKVWDIHIYFGYCLAALFLFRLCLEVFQLADKKLIRKIKSANTQLKFSGNKEKARHELAVKIIYAIFYVLLGVMVITGLCLAFEGIAFLKPFRHSLREVHGFVMYLILAFIAVHLIGVFLAERHESKGIVSDMINGGK